MNTDNNITAPPPRRGFFRRLFSWKALRRLLLGLAVLITAIVLVATLDSWRGARQWQACKAALEAKGEVLDWKKMIPPPIPDELNFAATPLLREIFTVESANHATNRNGQARLVARASRVRDDLGLPGNRSVPSRGDIQLNTAADLAGWATFFRGNTNFPVSAVRSNAEPAQVVLAALGTFDTELAELQQAAARPLTRFDVNYETDMPFSILLPHESIVRNLARVVNLRAIARLATGQNDAALADWKLSLRLADATKDEPWLISALVRVAILNGTLAVAQEGLARHAWTPAQLLEIERSLAAINLTAEIKQAMRGERAGSLGAMEYLKHPTRETDQLLGEPGLTRALLFAPTGWVSYNQVTMCDWYDRFIFPGCEGQASGKLPQLDKQMEEEIGRIKSGMPFNLLELRRTVLVLLMMPALNTAGLNSLRAQTAVDHTRIACALERHRIAHGEYPGNLAALTPEFLPALPLDPINGASYVYRREGAENYLLYGVGANGKDEGGRIVFCGYDKKQIDRKAGDWVWRWPPRAIEKTWTMPPQPKPLVLLPSQLALPARTFWTAAGARAAAAQDAAAVMQIFSALTTYAAVHDGRFPQQLSELVPQYLPAEQLASPLDPASPPQAEGYTLLTPGATQDQIENPATLVIVESKFARQGYPRSRGFADGHVE